MSRKAKFDDVQIKNGALEQEGKKIAAHLQKVREYEAAAKEKAGHELKKADEHFVSLTQELAAVKAKCRGAGFKVFKEKYCPDLSRSRIYQLLEIGTGKKTLEQSRAEKRDSVSKSRAAKESTTGASVVDRAAGLGNGEACENKKAELKALRELGASETERTAFITSLNAVPAEDSPEASAEKRKAEYAERDDVEPKPEPQRAVVTKAALMALVEQLSLLSTADIADPDLELYDALQKAIEALWSISSNVRHSEPASEQIAAREAAREAAYQARVKAEKKARRDKRKAEIAAETAAINARAEQAKHRKAANPEMAA